MDRAKSTRGWFTRGLRLSRKHVEDEPVAPIEPVPLPPRIHQNLSEISRLGGISTLKLPVEFAAAELTIPTHLAATAAYLREKCYPGYPGIFRVPGRILTIEALYEYFNSQIHSVQCQEGQIEQTIRSPTMPSEGDIPHSVPDVASVFKKFLKELPGGILGSPSLFEALIHLRSIRLLDQISEETAQKIASALLGVEDKQRLALISAVFGLLAYVKLDPWEELPERIENRDEVMTSKALAVIFAPLLLGDDMTDQVAIASTTERKSIPRLMGHARQQSQQPQAVTIFASSAAFEKGVQQIELCRNVVEMLIVNWKGIVKHFRKHTASGSDCYLPWPSSSNASQPSRLPTRLPLMRGSSLGFLSTTELQQAAPSGSRCVSETQRANEPSGSTSAVELSPPRKDRKHHGSAEPAKEQVGRHALPAAKPPGTTSINGSKRPTVLSVLPTESPPPSPSRRQGPGALRERPGTPYRPNTPFRPQPPRSASQPHLPLLSFDANLSAPTVPKLPRAQIAGSRVLRSALASERPLESPAFEDLRFQRSKTSHHRVRATGSLPRHPSRADSRATSQQFAPPPEGLPRSPASPRLDIPTFRQPQRQTASNSSPRTSAQRLLEPKQFHQPSAAETKELWRRLGAGEHLAASSNRSVGPPTTPPPKDSARFANGSAPQSILRRSFSTQVLPAGNPREAPLRQAAHTVRARPLQERAINAVGDRAVSVGTDPSSGDTSSSSENVVPVPSRPTTARNSATPRLPTPSPYYIRNQHSQHNPHNSYPSRRPRPLQNSHLVALRAQVDHLQQELAAVKERERRQQKEIEMMKQKWRASQMDERLRKAEDEAREWKTRAERAEEFIRERAEKKKGRRKNHTTSGVGHAFGEAPHTGEDLEDTRSDRDE